ncbi:MAG: AAA family ATPase [Anaerolineae bacterium]|nr:AAA family ATPase [Anaerolineae bacterium]
MVTPLLTTKLYVPPLRVNLLPRPRLIERLDEGLRSRHRLTLVSAPAGFGKTTLLSAWLQHLQERDAAPACTWLSLDKGDNVLPGFLTYLVAALRAADAEIGQSAQAQLAAPQLPAAASVIASLINDIAARARPLVLVLDDYHAITEIAVHEAVGSLLERQPSHMHLVIGSRHDPPLPLSRLRGRGQLTEIRQSDLRFTPEEEAAFLNGSMGLSLEAPQIADLGARTEGWVAGLQMAGLALQSTRWTDNVARFIDGFSGRHHLILDYLTDEVLRQQPEAMQRFLLATSILERMCGPLCDALLGDQQGQAMLEQLEHANLFVVPLDGERTWYRYHRLFGELLQARLRETAPDRVPELHRLALAWYEGHGYPTDAVHHALAARDFELAADVIERVTQRAAVFTSASVAMFREWLGALPEDVLRARPLLRLFLARVLYLGGQKEATERILEELERSLLGGEMTPQDAYILGLVTADRASYAAVRGDVRQAIDLAHRALALLPEEHRTVRIRVASILGLARFRAGEMDEAVDAFSRAIAAATQEGLAFAAVPFVCNLAEIQIAQGQLRQATQSCERALAMATVDGRYTSATGYVMLERAKILYEQNDLPAAERQVLEGLALLGASGTPDSFGLGRAVLARIKQAQGDGQAALAAIQEVMQIVREYGIQRLVDLVSAHQARIWLAQDRADLAAHWADAYRQRGEVEYLREFEDLTLARVLLAQGKLQEVSALLRDLLWAAEDAGRTGSAIEALALLALARDAQGDSDRAQDALQRSLTLAEPEGYVRVYVDAGQAMARLLLALARRDPGNPLLAYAQRLIASFVDQARAPGAGQLASGERAGLVEPLSDREAEVLALLAEGLSNREIGQRLFISLPTVKSHTRNIYGKLGVHSRDQAVVQARTLGLLPPASHAGDSSRAMDSLGPSHSTGDRAGKGRWSRKERAPSQ